MSRDNYDFELYQVEPVASLKEILDRSAKLYGDKTAFVYQQDDADELVSVSYQQYHRDVSEVASGLSQALKLDLSRRDSKKVALIAPNSYWWSVAYLSVVNLNQVIVPLDWQLPVDDLMTFIQRAGVTTIIYSGVIDEKIYKLKQKLHKIRHYLSLDKSEQATITIQQVRQLGRQLLVQEPDFYQRIPVYPEMLATLIFTSGTTGTPKGVMLSHKNFVSDIMGICQVNRFQDETLLSMLPLYHSFEWTLGLALQIYCGSTTYYLAGGLQAFADNLQRVRPTTLLLVPLIVEGTYQRVVASLPDPNDQEALSAALKAYYGGRLGRIFVGGAPINNHIADQYERCGIGIHQGYGISESSPAVAMNPDKVHKHRSVGRPLPNLKVKLDDKNTDGVGEVLVRGPTVMLGYYKDERNTERTMRDNWLHTGDFGYFDEDGFLYIVGRKKNVIIGKNAKNVYPEEIEYLLNSTPGIKDSLVYGQMMDDDLQVSALVVPDMPFLSAAHPELGEQPQPATIKPLIADLIEMVNQENVKYKAVCDFTLVESIPRTATGKIKRQAVQDL